MNFHDAACEYLAKYKVAELGVEESGLFTFRGKSIAKAHILPTRYRQLNILKEYRSRFFASEYAQIKFHKFFHHLNSSQAMCINLFYPLIAEKVLGLVTTFLGITSATELTPRFEKESQLEAAIRRTSFDFHIRHSGSHDLLFKVKYTEHGFAKAKNGDEHRKKFKDTYRSLVEESTYLADVCRDEKFFLNHCQVLRNLVHVSESQQVVLLFPAANSAVAREAAYAYEKLLTDAGRSKVSIVFLEEVVAFIESECLSESLVTYYSLFRKKYLPSVLLRPNKQFTGPQGRRFACYCDPVNYGVSLPTRN